MSVLSNEIRTEPRPNCLLCGLPGKLLYNGLPSAFFDTLGRWSFSQCSRPECGLIWINPTPVEADLFLAYQTYVTHGQVRGSVASKPALRDVLYKAYVLANYPLWLLSGVAREKRRWAQMFLQDVSPGRLFDVGCGDGRFLAHMQKRGWLVDGVDVDKAAVQTAHLKYGLSLRYGDLKAEKLPDACFDAVTIRHVVEHVFDPVGLLTEAGRILAAGGRLVITTPNTAGIGHCKFGPNWFGMDPPRHLNLFSRSSLSEVVRRAGLEIASAGSTSAYADVFIGASYTLRENSEHRMGHQPTPSVIRTVKAAWWQYREHLALRQQPDCGEELVIICKKRPC